MSIKEQESEITYSDDFEIVNNENDDINKEEESFNENDNQTLNKNETEVNMTAQTETNTTQQNAFNSTQNNISGSESPVFVNTVFGAKTTPIHFTIIATGQTGTTSATGGKLRMIYGRIYFLPVNLDKNINSDNYANIKIFSDVADKLDVRYVLNGHVAVIPLQNNIMISDETRLCILW